MQEKLIAVFSGLGVFVFLSSISHALYRAVTYPILYYFAISSVNVWYQALDLYLPLVAWLPGGLCAGYQVRRRGWLYGLLSVVIYQLGAVEAHAHTGRVVFNIIRSGPDWESLAVGLAATFFALVPIILSLGLAALGGWVGEWLANRHR